MASMMGISRLTTEGSLLIGLNIADNPRTRAMLHILLPTTLPTAIMLLAWIEEITLTTNSGADVPKATTVKPMTIGVTPRLWAKLEDPFTSHSAPKYSSTNPIKHSVIKNTIYRISFRRKKYEVA
jgi:hypothetical protein